MNNKKELIEKLKQIVKEHPDSFSVVISKKSKKNKFLYDFVMSETSHLDSHYTMATRLYWIINNIQEFPKCKNPHCNNTLIGKNVISFEKGWYSHCSPKCAAKSEERRKKIEATTLKRYGSTCFLSSNEGKQKRNEWCKMQGVENPFQLNWINEKRGRTMIKKYGHEFTQQCPELIEKCRETCRKHFGTDHQWASEEIRKKNYETIKKRFGVENVFLVDSIKEKQRITFRTQRYNDIAANKKVIPLFSLEDFINCENPKQTVFRWKCIENGHNHEFESLLDENTLRRYGAPARCWECHPNISIGFSVKETEVLDFIKSHCDYEVLHRSPMNRRIVPGREIDILIPEKKLGIEFDGIFFHSFSEDSEEAKDKQIIKTDYFESIGWKLIHINEDEWDNKKDIVESRILSIIGTPNRKIFARNAL